MPGRVVYKMKINGAEFIGTSNELHEIAGLSLKYFRQIACGSAKCPDGIEIERLDEIEKVMNQKSDLGYEWDRVVAMFKNAEWVRSGGKKLHVR